MKSINEFFEKLQKTIEHCGGVPCEVKAIASQPGRVIWEDALIINADDGQDIILIKHKDETEEWYPRRSPTWRMKA